MTNNAIESFNNIVKRNYTFGIRHSLPALFDIIIEHILVDVSLDIESQRKCYEIRRKPDITIRRNARAITAELYKIEQINQGIVMYTKRETNDSYVVDYLGDTCTCRYFIKHAYCKHLLHAHEVRNRDSKKIIIDRRFRYKGNTRRANRERGRARHAAPALQRN